MCLYLATLDPTYGAIVVALIAPIGAYILAARKMSGKIATSEATDLWAESRSIREWALQRIEAADKEILDLRASLRDVLEQLERAHEHIAALERRNE